MNLSLTFIAVGISLLANGVLVTFALPYDDAVAQCNVERSMKRAALERDGEWFTMYNLADHTQCAGRVPHPYYGSQQDAIGWVPCTSDAMRFRLNQSNKPSVAGSVTSPSYVGCFRDTLHLVGQSFNLPVQGSGISTWAHCLDWASQSSYALFAFDYATSICSASNDLGLAIRQLDATECTSCGDGTMCSDTAANALAIYAIANVTSMYPPPLPSQEYQIYDPMRGIGPTASLVQGFMANAIDLLVSADAGQVPYARLEIEGTGEIVVAQVFRGEVHYQWTEPDPIIQTWSSGVVLDCPSYVFYPNPVATSNAGSHQLNWAFDYYLTGNRIVGGGNYQPDVVMAIVPASWITARKYAVEVPPDARFLPEFVHDDYNIQYDTRPPPFQKLPPVWKIGQFSSPVGENNEVWFSALVRVVSEDANERGGYRFVFGLGDDPALGQMVVSQYPAASRYDSVNPANEPPRIGFNVDVHGFTAYFVNGTNIRSEQFAELVSGSAVCERINYFIDGVKAQYPAVTASSRIRFAELGAATQTQESKPFLTNYIETWTEAVKSITSGIYSSGFPHYRFFGPLDATCSCEYSSTINVGLDGICIDVNECLIPNLNTCGPMSMCINRAYYLDSTYFDCHCDPGFAYDLIRFRALRGPSDVNSTSGEEIVHCKETGDVRVSSGGIQARVGWPGTNYTAILYNTKLRVKDTSVVKWQNTFLGNVTQTWQDDPYVDVHRVLPHYMYALTVYFTNDPFNLIFDQVLLISCGCRFIYTFMPFIDPPPRMDDGRPLFTAATQYLGLIYANWIDDSRCDSSYTFERLPGGDDGFVIVDVPSEQQQDPVAVNAFSDKVTIMSRTRSPHQLIAEFAISQAQSLECGRTMGPLVIDTLMNSALVVGSSHYYCSYASGMEDGTTAYRSDYGCFPAAFVINWEARITVRVDAGYPSTFTSENDTLSSYVMRGIPVATGVATTGQRPNSMVMGLQEAPPPHGTAWINIQLNPVDWPALQLDDSSQIVVSIVPSRVDVNPIDNSTVVHQFLCHKPFRACSLTDPALAIIAHHSYDQIVVSIRDTTVVALAGTVFVGSANDETQRCPFTSNATICVFVAPGRDIPSPIQVGCAITDANGRYSIPVDMNAHVVVYVHYSGGEGYLNHTFSAVGHFQGQGSTVAVYTGKGNFGAVDFVDITTNTLFVDVGGGSCNVPVVDAASVVLMRDGCTSFMRYPLIPVVPGSPTAHFFAVVPATSWQVGLQVTSALVTANNENMDGGGGMTNYFAMQYGGMNRPNVDLSTLTAAFPTCGVLTNSTNCTGTDAPQSQLVSFVYHTTPTLNVSMLQDGRRVDSSSNFCNDPESFLFKLVGGKVETRYVVADNSRPVVVHIGLLQKFQSGFQCSNVTGSAFIVNDLGGLNNPCAGTGCRTPTTASGIDLPVFVIPELNEPRARLFTVSVDLPEGPTVSVPVQAIAFFVTGVVPPSPFEQFNVVYSVLHSQPLVIVRDPPGGSSFAYYTAATSTVTLDFNHMEVFNGQNYAHTTTTSSNVDMQACVGPSFLVSMTVCSPMVGESSEHSTTPYAKTESHAVTYQSNSTSVTFSVTWSATTSSEPAFAGSMSDLFLVLAVPIYFIETFSVVLDVSAVCSAGYTTSHSAIYGNPEVMFVTRYDVERHMKTTLERLGYDTDVVTWDTVMNIQPQFTFQPTSSPIWMVSMHGRVLEVEPEKAKSVSLRARRILVSDGRYFDPLPVGAGLWGDSTAFSHARSQIGIPPTITFTGGGAGISYEFDQEDLVEDGGNHYVVDTDTDSTTTDTHANTMWETTTTTNSDLFTYHSHWEATRGATTNTTRAVAGFHLSDPEPGDLFEMQVLRDLLWGTFYYNVTHGVSMCPPQAFTVPREQLSLEVLPISQGPSPPSEAQKFMIVVKNDYTEPGQQSDFILFYNTNTLADDVTVLVNGVPLLSTGTILQSIETWQSYSYFVQVIRGSKFFAHSIVLGLRSACDDMMLGPSIAHDDPARTPPAYVTLNAQWYHACPTLSLQAIEVGKLEASSDIRVSLDTNPQVVNFVIQNSNEDGLTLRDLLQHGTIIEARLEQITSEEQGWVLLDTTTATEPSKLVNLTELENPSTRFAYYSWPTAGPVFDDKETTLLVRAVVACPVEPGNPDTTASLSTSSLVRVKVDKIRPFLIGGLMAPHNVFPGSMPAGVFEFSEPIECVPFLPFTVTVTIYQPASQQELFVFSPTDANAHVQVTCSGAVITVNFVFADVEGRTLTRMDLLGTHAIVLLDGVNDMNGNAALSNIPQDPPLQHGKVQMSYDFMSWDPFTMLLEVSSLNVPSNTTEFDVQNVSLALEAALQERGAVDIFVQVTHVDVASFPGLTVVDAWIETTDFPGTADAFYALGLDQFSGYQFMGNGRLDVIPRSSLSQIGMLRQQHEDMLSRMTDTAQQLYGLATKLDILIRGLNFPTPGPTGTPSYAPTHSRPSRSPTTSKPSTSPTTSMPTRSPILPSRAPSRTPSQSPSSSRPSRSPTTWAPSHSPTPEPIFPVGVCSSHDTADHGLPECVISWRPINDVNFLDSSVVTVVRQGNFSSAPFATRGGPEVFAHPFTEIVIAPWTVSSACIPPKPPVTLLDVVRPSSDWTMLFLLVAKVNASVAQDFMCSYSIRFPVLALGAMEMPDTFDLGFMAPVRATMQLEISDNADLITLDGLSDTLHAAAYVNIQNNPQLRSVQMNVMDLSRDLNQVIYMAGLDLVRTVRFPAVLASYGAAPFLISLIDCPMVGVLDVRNYIGTEDAVTTSDAVTQSGGHLAIVVHQCAALERLRFDNLNMSLVEHLVHLDIDESQVRLARFMPDCPITHATLAPVMPPPSTAPTLHPLMRPSKSPVMAPSSTHPTATELVVPSSHPTKPETATIWPSTSPRMITPGPSRAPVMPPTVIPTAIPTQVKQLTFADFKAKCVAPVDVPDHDYDNLCHTPLPNMCPDIGNSSQTWSGGCWLPYNSYMALDVANVVELRTVECAMDANHNFTVQNLVLRNVSLIMGDIWTGLDRVNQVQTISLVSVNGLTMIDASRWSYSFTMSGGDMAIVRFNGTFAPTAIGFRLMATSNVVLFDVQSFLKAKPPANFSVQLYPDSTSPMAWMFPDCTGVMNVSEVVRLCSVATGSSFAPTTNTPTTKSPTDTPNIFKTTTSPTISLNGSVNGSLFDSAAATYGVDGAFVSGVVVGSMLGLMVVVIVAVVMRRRFRHQGEGGGRARREQSVVLRGRDTLSAANPMFGGVTGFEDHVDRQDHTFQVQGVVGGYDGLMTPMSRGSSSRASSAAPSRMTTPLGNKEEEEVARDGVGQPHFAFVQHEVMMADGRAGSVSEKV